MNWDDCGGWRWGDHKTARYTSYFEGERGGGELVTHNCQTNALVILGGGGRVSVSESGSPAIVDIKSIDKIFYAAEYQSQRNNYKTSALENHPGSLHIMTQLTVNNCFWQTNW